MTAKEAINLYKSRDASEKLFRADKTFLGNRSARVHSSESLDGKMLVSFVALIIRNRFYTKIKDSTIHMNSVSNNLKQGNAVVEM